MDNSNGPFSETAASDKPHWFFAPLFLFFSLLDTGVPVVKVSNSNWFSLANSDIPDLFNFFSIFTCFEDSSVLALNWVFFDDDSTSAGAGSAISCDSSGMKHTQQTFKHSYYCKH